MRGRRLFFSNLAFETDWRAVKDHMRKAGDVIRVDIFQDQDKNRSKGCGVVEFKTQDDCNKALETLNNSELQGRPLYLKYDKSLHPLATSGGPSTKDTTK
jgi:RNA recognition motif-containing protein